MLFKTYESAYYRHWEGTPPGYWLGCYGGELVLHNYLTTICNVDYFGTIGMWARREPTVNGETKIYAVIKPYYFTTSLVTVPWVYSVACWDGRTGDLLWVDFLTYFSGGGCFFEIDGTFQKGFMADDYGDLWIYKLGGLYRVANASTAFSAYPAGQAGMPNICGARAEYIADTHWTDETGTLPGWTAAWGQVWRPLVINRSADWIIGSYYAAMTVNGDQPPASNYVAVHAISTGRRLGYIQVRSQMLRGLMVGASTAYLFSNSGTLEIVDPIRMLNLSILRSAEIDGFSGQVYDFFGLGLAYDQVYKRLLILPTVLDDPATGDSLMRVYGYSPRPAPMQITKPLPLVTPREGRDVQVLSRVYGYSGEGVGGSQATFELTVGDGTLSPGTDVPDATGYAATQWTCGTEGVDAATIEVSTEGTWALEGIGEGTYTDYRVGQAPSSVEGTDLEDAFLPGFWLLSRATSRVRAQTAQQALGTYIADLLANDMELPQGVIMEYTWYELEPSFGTYDLSSIQTDVTYLKGFGLKVIIAVRVCPYLGGSAEFWIPDFITYDDSEFYQISGNVYTGYDPDSGEKIYVRGLFATNNKYATGYWDVAYPMIFDPTIRAVYQGLITAITSTFTTEDAVVGIIPINHPVVPGGSGVKYATEVVGEYTYANLMEARRSILQATNPSGLIVYEWLGPDTEQTDFSSSAYLELMSSFGQAEFKSHLTWAADNGYGLLAAYWWVKQKDYDQLSPAGMGDRVYSNWSTNVTGIAIPSWAYAHEHNLDALGNQATPLEMVFGGPDLVYDGARYCHWTEERYPWMTIMEISGSLWDTSEGIRETLGRRPYMNKRYYG